MALKIRRRLEDGTFGPEEQVFEAEKTAEILELEQRLAAQDETINELLFDIIPMLLGDKL